MPAITAEVEKVVNAVTAQRRETTEFFAGGVYRVLQCDLEGALVKAQTVAPIRVPGGQTAMAPVSWTEQDPSGEYITTQGMYGDPDAGGWDKLWERHGQQVLASVIPPTAEQAR